MAALVKSFGIWSQPERPFELIKSSLKKFLRFSLRADSFGGVAGGDAAPEQARPKAELTK